jgi:hypothetical protein
MYCAARNGKTVPGRALFGRLPMASECGLCYHFPKTARNARNRTQESIIP